MDWNSKLCFQLIEECKLNEVLWYLKNTSYYSRNLNLNIKKTRKRHRRSIKKIPTL